MAMLASLVDSMFKLVALVTMAAGIRSMCSNSLSNAAPLGQSHVASQPPLAPPKRPDAKHVIYVIGDTHGNQQYLVQSLLATGKFRPDRTHGLVIYVIGDTHGNQQYLAQSLLATGKFRPDPTYGLVWEPNPAAQNAEGPYTIYIVGDVVDRNPDDRTMLFLIGKLSAESKGRLVLLLGNHEMMTLQGNLKYARPDQYAPHQLTQNTWTHGQRDGGLIGDPSYANDAQLVQWLQSCPVIARHGGVLISHGGLSKYTLDLFLREHMNHTEDPDPDEVVQRMNQVARQYTADNIACFRKHRSRSGCNNPVPALLSSHNSGNSDAAGILWYRGYARENTGAGTYRACEEQAHVGYILNIDAMVNAHTTHNYIYQYCHDGLPCFAVDTHKASNQCKVAPDEDDGECENPGENPDHYELPPRSPQALRLELDGEDNLIAFSTCALLPGKSGNSTMKRYCRQAWIHEYRPAFFGFLG